MHELGLMADLVNAIEEQLPGTRVRRVRLRVGARAGVQGEALRFCFDVCSEGTELAGACLEIIESDGAELQLADVEVE